MSDCRKDEFSDWPQSLLAIGTFGNKQIEEVAQVENSSDNVQSVQDTVKFTEEEVDKIRKEFETLLAIKDQAEAQRSHDDDQVGLQKRADGEDNEKHIRQLINKRIIVSKSKNSLGKKGNTLKPRSVASLLKFFMCKGGFTSVVPEPRNTFPQSRMEKVHSEILFFLCNMISFTYFLVLLLSYMMFIAVAQGNIAEENTPAKFFHASC